VKLQIYSDLHVEFAPFEPPGTDADVVVLAGDIHVGVKGVKWALEKFPNKPVVYVLGNHEFYKQAYPRLLDKLHELVEGENVHILENSKLELNDTVILGCTLWTDFKLYGDPRIAGFEASQRMTDYRRIRVSPQFRRLSPKDSGAIHHQSVAWLSKELAELNERKVVVITHHAPSVQSFPDNSPDNLLNAAYASNLDDFVAKSNANLWIHGHIHVQKDYFIGSTRVLCNPRGYPDEPNEQFDEGMVIEI